MNNELSLDVRLKKLGCYSAEMLVDWVVSNTRYINQKQLLNELVPHLGSLIYRRSNSVMVRPSDITALYNEFVVEHKCSTKLQHVLDGSAGYRTDSPSTCQEIMYNKLHYVAVLQSYQNILRFFYWVVYLATNDRSVVEMPLSPVMTSIENEMFYQNVLAMAFDNIVVDNRSPVAVLTVQRYIEKVNLNSAAFSIGRGLTQTLSQHDKELIANEIKNYLAKC